MAQQHAHNSELVRLSDTDLILADEHQDIRNRKVLDRAGKDIGHIADLFIDEGERKVRFLQVSAGGFLGLGERHFLLPVDAITEVTEDDVRVNVTLERIVGSPVYDPRLVAAPTQATWGPYFDYYGLSPYWDAGYMYPQIQVPQHGHRRSPPFVPIL